MEQEHAIEPEWVDQETAARIIGVSLRTFQRWRSKDKPGMPQPGPFPGNPRFLKSDLLKNPNSNSVQVA